MATRPLPTRTSRDAPKFDGKDESVLRYFEDIDNVCTTAGATTDEEKIKAAKYYLTPNDEAIWSTSADTVWNTFKDSIIKMYPGSDQKKKFTLNDLDVFVTREAATPINSKMDLGRYHREFAKISGHLVKEGRMTRKEADKVYTKGLHPEFLVQLITRMRIAKPDADFDEPYEVADLYAQGQRILGGQIFYPTTSGSATEPSVKMEINEMSKEIKALNKELASNMNTLAATLSNMGTAGGFNSRYQGYVPAANRAPNPYQDRQPPRRMPWAPPPGALCSFCSGQGHYLRECPKVPEFIREGKCMKNMNGKITLPNGLWIPNNIEGPNLAARINRYHELNPGTVINGVNFVRDAPPHASTMWFASSSEPAESYYNSESRIEEVEDEEMDGSVYINEGVRRTRNNKPPEPEKPSQPMRRKGPPGRPHPLPEDPVPLVPPKKKTVAFEEVPTEGRKQVHTGPQYKFSTPIEDPEIAKRVLNRSLDSQITISQRELLSLSLDVRKQYKELVSTKRIPTVGKLESIDPDDLDNPDMSYILRYENPTGPDEEVLLTGSSIEKLRVIYPIVDEEKVECVLDGGSEIIAMNKGLWQKLGIHLRPDHKITMESANSQHDVTAGLIEDLKFNIGGLELYMKVHVVENAPFEILMGRPFFKLTGCITKDYTSGDQELTLTCPNTGRMVTVPTFVKPKRTIPPSVGFHPVGGRP